MTTAEDAPPPELDADAGHALRVAADAAGLPIAGAVLVRAGENAIYRLAGGVVARVSRTGQEKAAVKEVAVARWLEEGGVPAVRLAPDLDQPVLTHGRAVTFWQELPAHRHGTPREVGLALRRLHGLAPPTDFQLGPLLPFTRLRERIKLAEWLAEDDRDWLRQHLAELEARWPELPPGLPHCVVHGDAWLGNVVATEQQAGLLLDLERCSIGPPEWDLVSTDQGGLDGNDQLGGIRRVRRGLRPRRHDLAGLRAVAGRQGTENHLLRRPARSGTASIPDGGSTTSRLPARIAGTPPLGMGGNRLGNS